MVIPVSGGAVVLMGWFACCCCTFVVLLVLWFCFFNQPLVVVELESSAFKRSVNQNLLQVYNINSSKLHKSCRDSFNLKAKKQVTSVQEA